MLAAMDLYALRRERVLATRRIWEITRQLQGEVHEQEVAAIAAGLVARILKCYTEDGQRTYTLSDMEKGGVVHAMVAMSKRGFTPTLNTRATDWTCPGTVWQLKI